MDDGARSAQALERTVIAEREPWRARFGPAALLLLLTILAAGGYAILTGNSVFWCGRMGAYPGLHLLVGAVLLQGALFLGGLYAVLRHRLAPRAAAVLL